MGAEPPFTPHRTGDHGMLDLSPRRPHRIVGRTLGFGLSALVAAGILTWTPTVVSGWNQGAAESTLWQLMNGARSNNGIAPVQSHGTLVGLARWRSADMLAKDYFSHTIAGCGCLVYAYYDSNGLSYQWAGENIGWNSGLDDSYSPVAVHEAFMNSAGHRANVLDGRFTHGGVGAAAADGRMYQGYVQNTRMYTELFMQAYSAPAPAPAPTTSTGSTTTRRTYSGGTTAPSTTRTAAPAPKPKPKPKEVSVAAPTRPTSTAGLDGVASIVSRPGAGFLAHLDDEVAATRFALELTVDEAAAKPAAEKTATVVPRGEMEVEGAAPASAGLFDGIVGAVLGFLFG